MLSLITDGAAGDTTITAGLSSGLTSGSIYPSSGLTYTSAETALYTSHFIVTATSWISTTKIAFLVPFPSLAVGALNTYTVTSSISTTYTDGSKYYMSVSTPSTHVFISPAPVTVTTLTAITAVVQSSGSLSLIWEILFL